MPTDSKNIREASVQMFVQVLATVQPDWTAHVRRIHELRAGRARRDAEFYTQTTCLHPGAVPFRRRTWALSLSASQLSHLSARDVHSKRSSGSCLEDQTNSSSEANRTNLAYSELMPRKWPSYRGRTTAQVALVLMETSESNLENNEGTARLLHSQRGAGKSGGAGVLGIQGWI